jgi:hypothetical protein
MLMVFTPAGILAGVKCMDGGKTDFDDSRPAFFLSACQLKT